MSKDAILRVKQAEAEAADIRAEAEREANRRIENAEKNSATQAETVLAELQTGLKEELAHVRDKAAELIEESRREVEEDIAALEATAEERMREAVKLIVWEMYDECQ